MCRSRRSSTALSTTTSTSTSTVAACMLGEVAPASNVPVGIYDENGNWKMTTHSDVNGFYEALVPSMDTYNCPLPAGPCPNVYRLVGNDPGTLAHRNLDYNPQFRTIATEFQAWTGVVHPVDQAPPTTASPSRVRQHSSAHSACASWRTTTRCCSPSTSRTTTRRRRRLRQHVHHQRQRVRSVHCSACVDVGRYDPCRQPPGRTTRSPSAFRHR